MTGPFHVYPSGATIGTMGVAVTTCRWDHGSRQDCTSVILLGNRQWIGIIRFVAVTDDFGTLVPVDASAPA